MRYRVAGICICLALSLILCGCGELLTAVLQELEGLEELEELEPEEPVSRRERSAETRQETETTPERSEFEDTAPDPAPRTEQGIETGGITFPKIAYVESCGSADNRYRAEYAVDEDESTCWITAENTDDVWIRIYFEEPAMVGEVLIVNGNQESYEIFQEHGRLRYFQLLFDDGDSTELEVRVDDAYWSGEFIPRRTSWVELRALDLYPGSLYNDMAITEITLFYNPDSILAQTSAPIFSGLPVSETGEDITGYTPRSFTWTTTGYDAQDIDHPHFVAGKWLTREGNKVLYIDYPSSPDFFTFELFVLYENGSGESVAEAAISEKNASYAEGDAQNPIVFRALEPGVMNVAIGPYSYEFVLTRAKYR